MRSNGPARPIDLISAVRARLGVNPRPDVEPSPAEALPLNPLADLDATQGIRRMLAHGRDDGARLF